MATNNLSVVNQYDEITVGSIVDKIRKMAPLPSDIAYSVLKDNDTSWAATIAAQLFIAMYDGNIKACKIMLDRLDGSQVKRVELMAAPVEVRYVKAGDKVTEIADGIVRLDTDLVPREYQLDILKAFDNGIRRFCIVQTRRSGKTWLHWRLMIREAIKKKANYLYVFDSEKQLKESIWEAIDNNGVNFIDYIPKELVARIEQGDFRITLTNGSTIRLMLGSNPDSLRGSNPYGIILDEFGTLEPTTIQVLTPILEMNGGWLVATGTPRGNNHFKKTYDAAVKDPEWYAHTVKASTSGLFTEDKLKKIRQDSIDFYGNEAFYQQEYECSWISPNSGSVFGELTNIMINKGHYTKILYDKDLPVYTAWDLGNADKTVIIFFQINKDQDIKVINFVEASRATGGVEYFAREIAKKGYPVQTHFLPFDADYHKGARNETYIGELKKLGIRNVKVLKRVSTVTDKLNFLRTEFKRLYIHDKLDRLIDCLRGMEYEWNDKKQTWSTRPSHSGGFSDVCDALCYMAQASRDIDGVKPYSGNTLVVQRPAAGLYGFGRSTEYGRNNRGGYMF